MVRESQSAPLRILLVEDHPDTLNAMAKLLRFSGYQVSTAGSLSEAVALADGGKPDLLVCDLTLPDGQGADVLRAGCHAREIPGIAVPGALPGPLCHQSERAGVALRLVTRVGPAAHCAAIESVPGLDPARE